MESNVNVRTFIERNNNLNQGTKPNKSPIKKKESLPQAVALQTLKQLPQPQKSASKTPLVKTHRPLPPIPMNTSKNIARPLPKPPAQLSKPLARPLPTPPEPISKPVVRSLPNPPALKPSNVQKTTSVTMGQGEYVVFHTSKDGQRKAVSKELFDKIYQIIDRHSPLSILNNSEGKEKNYLHRSDLIKQEIKKIDPSLEVVFLPRTLYELIFIRKCIKEDTKNKSVCPMLEPYAHNPSNANNLAEVNTAKRDEIIKKRKCWHLCFFNDIKVDSNNEKLKEIAFRLNKAVCKTLNPSAKGFSVEEYLVHAEKEISYLKKHHEKCMTAFTTRVGMEECPHSIVHPGPTTNFGFESSRGSAKPMGIRNEEDAQMIKKAVALECSETARDSFILYRGSNMSEDDVVSGDDKNGLVKSLSYGTGVFAGALFDGGATAFHYMRNKKNAYALAVPFEQVNNSPFCIPRANTLAQLYGEGEVFHVRTKAWKGYDPKEIGFGGASSSTRDQLFSNIPKDDFIKQFRAYKQKAIHLKKEDPGLE